MSSPFAQIITDNDLNFALNLCKQAGELVSNYFYQGVSVTLKTDQSPVTIADQECELLIRNRIKEIYPDDAILGEEGGDSFGQKPNAIRRWIIDPIDGTYNFARKIPLFSILLALEVNGQIELGIIYNPILNDLYYAKKGLGAYKNAELIKVSPCRNLNSALFNFGAINRIFEHNLTTNFVRLVKSTYRQRGFGDYLNFGLVFEGKAELALEIGLQPWDLAPMAIIATEAGGKFTSLNGVNSIYEGNCLVSNKILHQEVLAILNSK